MLLLATFIWVVLAQCQEDKPKITYRDVCVIGGHSGGVYTALRLKQLGTSMALIDHTSHIAGNVPTYEDPETGLKLDYGPWQESAGTYGFTINMLMSSLFDYIGYPIPMYDKSASYERDRVRTITEYIAKQGLNDSAPAPVYLDFFKGTKLDLQPDGTPFGKYGKYDAVWTWHPWKKLKDKYRKIMDGEFDLSSPVPYDLLQSPLEFLKSNGAWPQLMFLWESCEGMLDPVRQPILYSLKFCRGSKGDQALDRYTFNNDRVTMNKRNFLHLPSARDFFSLAERKLGEDLFLDTTVRKIEHTTAHIDVHILQSGQKQREIIRAKKIVFSEQPSDEIIRYFEANPEIVKDYEIFKDLKDTSHLYSAVVKDNVFHPKRKFYNAPSLSDSNKHLPSSIDGIYYIGPAQVRNLRTVSFTDITRPTVAEAKDRFLGEFRRIANFTNIDIQQPNGTDFEVLAINVISPYMRTYRQIELANNSYQKLNSLQGLHKTWWVGPAFSTHILAKQWEWIEDKIMPTLVRG